MKKKAQTKKERIEDLADLLQPPADVQKSLSETKNSLQALQASETRYRRLFETAQDGILILNAETGKIDDVNPYMIDMLHYSREEFLGKQLWEVSPFKNTMLNIAAFEELQDKGYIRYKDLPLETKEGKPIAVEFVSNVYQANGNKVIQCNIRNINESKEVNRKLQEAAIFQQRLIDTLPVPIFYNDSEGRYLGCNSSFEKLFGQKREQVAGKSVYELAPKEIADIYHEKDLALLQNPGIQIYESVVKDTGGVVHNVIFHKATFPNMDGSVGGLIGAILDITDRKRAESEIQTLAKFPSENPNPVLRIARDGTLLYVNEASLNQLPDWHLQVGRRVPSMVRDVVSQAMTSGKTQLLDLEHREQVYSFFVAPIAVADYANMYGSDITERKQAEKALKESENKYRLLADNVHDVIFVLDMNLKYTYVSPSVKILRGYEPEEVLKQSYTDILTPSSIDLAMKTLSEIMELEKIKHGEITESRTLQLEMRRKDGTNVWTEVKFSAIRDKDQWLVGILGVTRDITERKRTTEALKTSEERFRTAAESLTDVVYDWDIKEKVDWYGDIDGIMGYPPGGFPRTIEGWAATINPEDKDRVMAALEDHLKGLASYAVEYRVGRRDGEWRWWSARGTALRDDRGEPYKMIGSISDITERKRAENALRESEEKYRTILEGMDDVYFETDIKGNITFVNHSSCKMSGYPEEELIGMPFKKISAPDDIEKVMQYFGEIFLTGKTGKPFLWKLVKKNGEQGFFEIVTSLIKNKNGKLIGFRGIGRDVTERRQAEATLKESENKYRLLADNVHDVIFVLDMNLKYTYISPSVKILRGYEPEEVLKQQSIEQTLTPSSQDLAMRTFSEVMELEKSGHGEINKPQILQLEMSRKDGTTVWTEVNFSFIRDEDQRPVGIIGLTRDITERKKGEEELQRTLKSLNNAFGATVQVMVSAIESKDPYTSGHQFRAAKLACAIAKEMGLPQDKIEGLQMAGSIHDIGKLSIPAEILSKPTKLTNLEFSMIKEHSQKGYDMLKDVESPWPLAQIVYQHHERMDGSGYPRNLKGDEIIMEARIMAVADVVEAMASHRPYRPGLGIDAALAEIEKNKGTHYDNTVADACLRLFREKGYQLEGTVL